MKTKIFTWYCPKNCAWAAAEYTNDHRHIQVGKTYYGHRMEDAIDALEEASLDDVPSHWDLFTLGLRKEAYTGITVHRGTAY